ncbi:MAG: MOSC domain-containing protein [Verrucomicrobiota bacterium]
MKVLSVNRSLPRTLLINGKEVSTGIYKEPQQGHGKVGKLGLEGDGQADLTVHGGLWQALYAYPIEHYPRWENEVGRSGLPPGTFGENLTLEGLIETEVCIGDIHRMGELLLEVTSPRIPCFKLGHKLGKPDILKSFLQSGCSGFYYRVLEGGSISADTVIEVVSRDAEKLTVRELLGLYRLGEGGVEDLRRALQVAAISPLVRHELAARLAKLS